MTASSLATEVRCAFRRTGRSRGFVLATVLVLGLGLGANLILFNTAYALLWRPLGFPQPERLLTLYSQDVKGLVVAGTLITGRQSGLLAEQAGSLAAVGLVASAPKMAIFVDAEDVEPVDVVAARVNSGYISALGLQPLGGRLFSEEEDRGGDAEELAVVLEKPWRKYFRSDLSIVGRRFWYDNGAQRRQVRILGILRGTATLPFAPGAELLLSLPWRTAGVQGNFGDAAYRCVLLAKPQIPLDQVSTHVQLALAEAGGRAAQAEGKRDRYWTGDLRSAMAPVDTTAVFLLSSAGCLLLTLMCANLASLFLARAIGRSQESSLRLALGASWLDLLLTNILEAALLCPTGTLVAFGFNSLSRPWVTVFAPAVTRVGPELLATGPMLVLFGVVLSLGVALVIALPVTLHGMKTGLSGVLSRWGGERVAARSRGLMALLTLQLSIVLTLLTVSTLILRSFQAASRSDAGFDASGVVIFRLSLPVPQSAMPEAASDVARVIASIPGAGRVAFAAESPLGSSMGTVMNTHGGEFGPRDPIIGFRMVGTQYFETLGARLLGGRTFSADEIQRAGAVVILNEAAARTLFGATNPIGRTVHSGFLGLASTVVGVVKDIRHDALDKPSGPVVYMPYRPVFPGSLSFIARTANAQRFRAILKARLQAWNSRAFIRDFGPLQEVVAQRVRYRLLSALLLGGFAFLGLTISMVGLYGTLASQVKKRKREIGIRIALGASPGTVATMVLGQGARVLAGGLSVGLAGSIAASYMIRRLLYGVETLDVTSFVVAVVVLSAAALSACLSPALSAFRVDPAEALRAE